MYGLNQYGVTAYSSDGDVTDSDILALSPDLLKYLPDYYQISTDGLFYQIIQAISKQFGKLMYKYNDAVNQLTIDTATWGLTKWEQDYGIDTNLEYSYESRKEVLNSKRKSTRTSTIDMIKDTAESFSGGEVSITEYNNEYYFIVQFIGVMGIPTNLQSFKNMLEEIKPAHLQYILKYSYTTWNFIKNDNLTWNSVIINTWNELKVYK